MCGDVQPKTAADRLQRLLLVWKTLAVAVWITPLVT